MYRKFLHNSREKILDQTTKATPRKKRIRNLSGVGLQIVADQNAKEEVICKRAWRVVIIMMVSNNASCNYRDTVFEGNALEGVILGYRVLDQELVPGHVPGRSAVLLGRPARIPYRHSFFHLVVAIPVSSSIHRRRPPRGSLSPTKINCLRVRTARLCVYTPKEECVYFLLLHCVSHSPRTPTLPDTSQHSPHFLPSRASDSRPMKSKSCNRKSMILTREGGGGIRRLACSRLLHAWVRVHISLSSLSHDHSFFTFSRLFQFKKKW